MIEPKYKFVFDNLPKVSFNKFYESKHWGFRTGMKKKYSRILGMHYNCIDCSKQYDVEYTFQFKIKPLDATNTMGMVKMIEDVLFKNDGYKVVLSVRTSSSKGKKDSVEIKVWERL